MSGMYWPGIERDLARKAQRLIPVRTETSHRPEVVTIKSQSRQTDFPKDANLQLDSMEIIETKAKLCAERMIHSSGSSVCLTGKALGSYFDAPIPGRSPIGTAHRILALIMETGILTHIVSTDTRGLFIRAGVPPNRISEIHGNVLKEICPHCGTAYYRDEIAEGPKSRCLECDKQLVNSCTGWGSGLVETERKRASNKLSTADVIIIAGSLLNERIARSIPFSEKTFTVIISTRKTKYDHLCDVHVKCQSGLFLSSLAQCIHLEIPAESPQFNELIIPRQTLPWKYEENIVSSAPFSPPKMSPQKSDPERRFEAQFHDAGFWTAINSNYEHCRSLLTSAESHISEICLDAPEQFDNCSKTLQRLKEIETCLSTMYNSTFRMLSGRSNFRPPNLDSDLEMAKQLSLLSSLQSKSSQMVEILEPEANGEREVLSDPIITQLGRPPLISKESLDIDEVVCASPNGDIDDGLLLDDDVTEEGDVILGVVPGESENPIAIRSAETKISSEDEEKESETLGRERSESGV